MRIFKDNLSTFTHWFAWTFSIAASVLFLIFLITDDIPVLFRGENPQILGFVLTLSGAIVGTIMSLFNRVYGGAIQLLCAIGLVLYFYNLSEWADIKLMVLYGLPYFLSGFLLLIVKK